MIDAYTSWCMHSGMRKRISKNPEANEPQTLREAVPPFGTKEEVEPMVRTQIYLSKAEHEFVQSESARRDEPMAAVIRAFIEEKMIIPDHVWQQNPLLDPPADDPAFAGHEDGGINHDHFVSGSPKKYKKANGKWIWKRLE